MPIEWLTLLAALVTGLMGGVHCAAMCGGIATGFSAVAAQGGWWRALQPNLGRIGGYIVAGALAGGIGSGVVGIVRIPWIGPASRMLVGLVLVVAALRLLDPQGRRFRWPRAGIGLWQRLRPLQRRLLPADSVGKRLALGMLWGWMPCGLSTTLLAAAWLQADARNGALTMAMFGLGTLPMMLPLTWSGARLGQYLHKGPWRAATGALVLAAGTTTLVAPWLMHAPQMRGVLIALGCVQLPA